MQEPRSFRVTGKAVVLGLIAFFLFFAATNIRSGWLYMVDAVLASLLLYSGIVVWRSSATLRVTRRQLHIAQQGEDVPVTLRVENAGPRPFLCFKLTDVFPPRGLSAAEAEMVLNERFILRLPAGEAREFTYYLPCRRRGRYSFGAYRVTLYGPLGLFSRTRTFPLASELLVYPQLPELSQLSSGGVDQRQLRSGDIPQPFLIGRAGMLPKGVRDYRPGDSPRLVHWRVSARMRKLMVKDLEVETGLAFNLFLDTTPTADEESFERALKVVGAIAQYSLKHGHACQILTHNGREPAVSAPRLLDFLARLEADSTTSLPDRLARLADLLGARASAILALQRLDASIAAALARLLSQNIAFSLFVCGDIDPAARSWCEQHGIPMQVLEAGSETRLPELLHPGNAIR